MQKKTFLTIFSGIMSATLITSSALAAPVAPVTVKFFGAGTIGVGGSTTLDITVNNQGTTNFTGLTFTDTIPAGIAVATPNGLLSACTPGSTLGAISATAGGNVVSLAASTILAGGACTVQVNVVGTAPGLVTNSVTATDPSTGPGAPGTASINVLAIAPPTIAKAFGAPTIPLGGTTSVTITITAVQALANVNFTDTLPAGLAFATPSALAQNCGGVAVAATGPPAVLSLTGGALAAGGTCTVSANVTGITAGTDVNSVTVSDAAAGVGNTATATLLVLAPPTITKAFGVPQIQTGASTSLTVNITNPNAGTALTGVAFTDTLPAGLLFATPSGLASTCGGVAGAITGPPAILQLTGGALAAGATCTITANVTGVAPGNQVNTTGAVTSTNGGTGLTATAAILVTPGDAYQVSYASNLVAGDSYVDLTNSGANVDPTGTTSQNMCVNVYTFDPSEELVSCCACPVTPNGLNSLSVKQDLVSNTLTPGVPGSVVIKLLATTVPVGGTCNASLPTLATLAPGLVAWDTTLTQNTSVGNFETNRVRFSPATQSTAELARLTTFCGFIQANGSGFGICRSCRIGALGGAQQ